MPEPRGEVVLRSVFVALVALFAAIETDCVAVSVSATFFAPLAVVAAINFVAVALP